MKNITSFLIQSENNSGIVFETKEDFLQYLSEEIDRVDEENHFNHFDIIINPNND